MSAYLDALGLIWNAMDEVLLIISVVVSVVATLLFVMFLCYAISDATLKEWSGDLITAFLLGPITLIFVVIPWVMIMDGVV